MGLIECEFVVVEDEEVVDVEEVVECVDLYVGVKGFDDVGVVVNCIVVGVDEWVFLEVEFVEFGFGIGLDCDVVVVVGDGFIGEMEGCFFEKDVEWV